MTRKSKIARLPRPIREELNRRLDENEPGVSLVAWLNGRDEVRLVLEQEYQGRPINDQNLSDWKQGGFVDWQRHQERRDWARIVGDEAREVSDDSGLMPLSDHLSSVAAFALGSVIRDLAAEASADTGKRDDLLRALKELARLRRNDLEAARVRNFLELTHAQRSARL